MTVKNIRVWDRKQWGVVFTSPRSKPMLLGALWDNNTRRDFYEGESTRVLLFSTRKAARKWCATKKANCTVDGWRFSPVRVRELVTVIAKT